jgi:hypothetical protein
VLVLPADMSLLCGDSSTTGGGGVAGLELQAASSLSAAALPTTSEACFKNVRRSIWPHCTARTISIIFILFIKTTPFPLCWSAAGLLPNSLQSSALHDT